ncbi:MAG: AmmeMemoRadiSam system protein A [Halothiobacillaceae bacterium]
MNSTERPNRIDPPDHSGDNDLEGLPDLARSTIAAALAGQDVRNDRDGPACDGQQPERWRQPGASFVTLHKDGRLRGCIGSLEARQPLGQDVIQNALDAAFRDPRFPPLSEEELPRIDISVSVLGPMSPLQASGTDELIARLRPGEDGLVIATPDGNHQATFLPSVWNELPTADDFLRHLLRKAGLPGDYRGPLRAWRYAVSEYHEQGGAGPRADGVQSSGKTGAG